MAGPKKGSKGRRNKRPLASGFEDGDLGLLMPLLDPGVAAYLSSNREDEFEIEPCGYVLHEEENPRCAKADDFDLCSEFFPMQIWKSVT